MKKIIKILLLVGVVSFNIAGCNQQKAEVRATGIDPQWLLDPYIDGDKIAATGCASSHFKGVGAQKKLAISRAVDDIAKQKQVRVENITLNKKSYQNGNKGSTSSQSSSLQEVSGVSFSTKVKAVKKVLNGDICAWVVLK